MKNRSLDLNKRMKKNMVANGPVDGDGEGTSEMFIDAVRTEELTEKVETDEIPTGMLDVSETSFRQVRRERT